MIFDFDIEQVLTVTFMLVGATVSTVLFFWRVFIVTRKFINNQETMKASLSAITSEVTCNGGRSIKDIILNLNETCSRMELRQKIIDQRSKAALQYQDRCLFETDKDGQLVWANENFYQYTVDYGDISGGLDWIAVIDEDERENFVTELNSCLEMGRRLDIETVSVNNQQLQFIGHPYRVGEGQHEGFLIHIQTLEN